MSHYTREQIESWGPQSAELLRAALGEDTLPFLVCDEKHFQAEVLKFAKRCGWLCYHTHDSRKSQRGFPDLVMIRGCFMVVAELKVGKNDLSEAQHDWMVAFESVAYQSNDRVRYFVWYPQDWPEIVKVLARE